MKKWIALLLMVLANGGCAMYGGRGLEPGVSADAVRAKLGQPVHRYEYKGQEIWEYDHGPYAYYAYHYTFNTDHVLTQAIQTRTEQNAKNLVPHASTREDVKAIIGWPVYEHQVRGNTLWEWPMMNYVGLRARLVVQFADDGTVSAVATYPLPTGPCCRRTRSISHTANFSKEVNAGPLTQVVAPNR